jgi:predicted Zn-dependent peptidase
LKTGQSVESVGWGKTVLVYGFPAANRSSNERYAFDVIASVLSGPSDLTTENISNSRGGALLASVVFSTDREAESRAKLDAAYARLRQDGVSADDLRSSIQYAVGTHDAALQTRESRVFEYARAIYGGSGIPSVAGYAAAVQAVTATQVKSVVERYMDPEGLRTAVVRGQAQP